MRAYERFLKYIQYDTASDENSTTCPSTETQWVLARDLAKEMQEMGMQDVRVDEHCYVYGCTGWIPPCSRRFARRRARI